MAMDNLSLPCNLAVARAPTYEEGDREEALFHNCGLLQKINCTLPSSLLLPILMFGRPTICRAANDPMNIEANRKHFHSI